MGTHSMMCCGSELHEDSEPMQEPIPHCDDCDSTGTRIIEDWDNETSYEIPCSCPHAKLNAA